MEESTIAMAMGYFPPYPLPSSQRSKRMQLGAFLFYMGVNLTIWRESFEELL
jgi:hypothetical protein